MDGLKTPVQRPSTVTSAVIELRMKQLACALAWILEIAHQTVVDAARFVSRRFDEPFEQYSELVLPSGL